MNETPTGLNMIVYLDNLQRLMMAEKVSETDTVLKVKNPVIINIQSQNQQINVQFFPVIMREMLADADEATVWTVNKSSITLCEKTILNARLIAQYQHICSPMAKTFAANPAAQSPKNSTGPVIKLFDD